MLIGHYLLPMPTNNSEPEKYTNPHDELFKDLITSFFKEFMQLFWPEESKQIDFRTVKFLNQEFAIGKAQNKPGKRRLDIVADPSTPLRVTSQGIYLFM